DAATAQESQHRCAAPEADRAGRESILAAGQVRRWAAAEQVTWADLHAEGAILDVCQPTPFSPLRNGLQEHHTRFFTESAAREGLHRQETAGARETRWATATAPTRSDIGSTGRVAH